MKREFFIFAAAAGLAIAASSAQAQSKIVRVEAGNPGSLTTSLMTVLSKIYKREFGYSLQINDGQTLTRSALKLGRGKVDMMPFPPIIYHFMSKGAAMYKKKLHKQAIAASKNVRMLMGHKANLYHAVAFDGAGVKTWKDIKGKRVFTGPPSGAAAVQSERLIKLMVGYTANKDYKAIRLPWGSGLQAMMDGKLDVYIRPAGIGDANIEQLGSKKGFYLLNAGPIKNGWDRKYTKGVGRVVGTIPKGTYKGQLNKEDVTIGGALFTVGVRAGLSDEMAYNMTKGLWENLAEIHKSAKTLEAISFKTPFIGVNAPLHPGAVRYYKEKGVAIPARLMPK